MKSARKSSWGWDSSFLPEVNEINAASSVRLTWMFLPDSQLPNVLVRGTDGMVGLQT